MKKLGLILGLLLFASSVSAQGSAELVAQAKADVQAAGQSLMGACGAFRITNLVAQRLGPNFGLLRKLGGNRAVPQPDGSCLSGEQSSLPNGYATDYLIDRTTFYGYDILGDGGGANNPQWGAPETAADMVARNRQNVAEPVGVSAPSAPPVLPPPPTPLPSVDFSAILNQLAILNAKLDNLAKGNAEALASVDQNVTDGRKETQEFRSAVGNWWKVVVKYAGPAVAALLAGRASK